MCGEPGSPLAGIHCVCMSTSECSLTKESELSACDHIRAEAEIVGYVHLWTNTNIFLNKSEKELVMI